MRKSTSRRTSRKCGGKRRVRDNSSDIYLLHKSVKKSTGLSDRAYGNLYNHVAGKIRMTGNRETNDRKVLNSIKKMKKNSFSKFKQKRRTVRKKYRKASRH